ncbi:MAG: MBL fold metallo-hydrolase [Sulfurospirillaceae bacterium]|nr:MBL fold metallo-hydrolase [Sulfurospirillaceae bacterium]
MEIKQKACGAYGTNCYIVSIDGKDLIIDPGMDSYQWVISKVKNPIAILNTHGHFDHVWGNQALVQEFSIPLYAPKDDIFMLENDPFSQGTPASHADVIVEGNATFDIQDIMVRFFHFPGHTPGCSAILIENKLFSGDFIFKNSIGRFDFPYSSATLMRQSLEKFLKIEDDWGIFPGHGESTSVRIEQKNIPYWFNYL